MSDPFTLDDDPFVLVVPASASIPPGNITDVEWLALKDRVLVVEERGLAGLVDTSGLAGAASGDVPVYDAETGEWSAGSVSDPVSGYGGTSEGSLVVATIGEIYAGTGLVGRASTDPGKPDAYVLEATFGNAASTIAEGNHRHAIYRDERFTSGASGTLSSGTRGLGSGLITGLLGDRNYIIKATLRVDLRGEGTGAGYTLPRITINGDTVTRFAQSRTVSGVDREASMQHPGTSVNGSSQSSVSVSAEISYQSGDPIYVGASELVVSIESQR